MMTQRRFRSERHLARKRAAIRVVNPICRAFGMRSCPVRAAMNSRCSGLRMKSTSFPHLSVIRKRDSMMSLYFSEDSVIVSYSDHGELRSAGGNPGDGRRALDPGPELHSWGEHVAEDGGVGSPGEGSDGRSGEELG